MLAGTVRSRQLQGNGGLNAWRELQPDPPNLLVLLAQLYSMDSIVASQSAAYSADV